MKTRIAVSVAAFFAPFLIGMFIMWNADMSAWEAGDRAFAAFAGLAAAFFTFICPIWGDDLWC